jgi:hypothetical protein
MEVKINREIRSYSEAIFFGLSLRQFVFSLLAVAVGVYFLLKPRLGTETVSCMRTLRRAVRRDGVYPLQRPDGGAFRMGVAALGVYCTEKADIPRCEHLL